MINTNEIKQILKDNFEQKKKQKQKNFLSIFEKKKTSVNT